MEKIDETDDMFLLDSVYDEFTIPDGSSGKPADGYVFSEKFIGSIARCIKPFNVKDGIDKVIDFFQQNPEIEAVPLENEEGVSGYISRKILDKSRSSRLMMFGKKCGEFIEKKVSKFNGNDYVYYVMEKVNEMRYLRDRDIDYILIFLNGIEYYGIVSVRELERQMNFLLKRESETAYTIQKNFLDISTDTLGYPFEIGIWNKMAHQVGGDFYTAILVTPELYLAGVFDVSGKNVSAALITSLVASFFQMLKFFPKEEISELKLVLMMDEFLKNLLPVGYFVTASLCFINLKTNTAEILNCGHTKIYAFMRDAASNCVKILTLPAKLPPLGVGAVKEVIDENDKIAYKFNIASGIQIDMYSDGFLDMENSFGLKFEEDNVKQFFKKLYKEDIKDMKDIAKHTVESWSKEFMLPDDVTIMNVKFL